MTPIHICLASDENYAMYLGLTVMSILEHANEDDEIYLYILSNCISDPSKNRIADLCEIRPFYLQWIEINDEFFEKCHPGNGDLTITTYARFLVPSLVPVDKVLYLDCDLLIRTSLRDLYLTDVEQYYAAGVVDFFVDYQFISTVISEELSPSNYFNAGVLLINNRMWRASDVQNMLFDYAVKNSTVLRFADQDCLNYVLKNKVKIIDPVWNVTDLFYDPVFILKLPSCKEIVQAGASPNIRHFKPWKKNNYREFRDEYIEMMKRSPWSEFVPVDDFTFVGWVKLFWIFAKRNPFFWGSKKFYLRVKYRGLRRTITRRIA